VPSDDARRAQPLPAGVRLVHFGFHKSGTTALQESFLNSRGQLAHAGVAYPMAGDERHHGKPALSLLKIPYGWKSAGIFYDEKYWTDLVEEVEGYAGEKVVVSSEHLAQASPEVIRRIVTDLGRERVHAVATVRPLDKILPSSWQQYVKNALKTPYIEWLQHVLADPPDLKTTPSFWRRHHHGDIISRWAAELGPENVTVVITDDKDRGLLFHSFEELLDLPEGLLAGARRNDDNRSLTAIEADLVQQLSRVMGADGVDYTFQELVLRRGVAQRLARDRVPPPDEPRISTPQWALDRATEIGQGFVKQIADSGVTVIGDLSSLGRYTSAPGPDHPDPLAMVPMDVAVASVRGALRNYRRHYDQVEASARKTAQKAQNAADKAAGRAPTTARPVAATTPPIPLEGRAIGTVGSRRLLRVVSDRAQAKARRVIKRRLGR
jgi:hypothetical protein